MSTSTHHSDRADTPGAIEAGPPESPGDVAEEIRTRRLVVEDHNGDDRIVAEVDSSGAAMVTVTVPTSAGEAVVLLYACPPPAGGFGEDMGPAVGVQCWADGDAHLEQNVWQEGSRWRAALSTDDVPGDETEEAADDDRDHGDE